MGGNTHAAPPPAGRRRVLLTVLGVAALVLGATAWYAGDRRGGPARADLPPGATLALVGDSITYLSSEELTSGGRGAGWSPVIRAAPGAITPEMQSAAAGLAATRPAAAVVHLGTNDWVCAYQLLVPDGRCRIPGFTVGDRDGALTTMARTLHDAGACVVGVIPVVDHGVDGTWGRLRDEGLAEGVADWRTEAGLHHDDYLADDLGHLTPDGRAAYARFILAAVSATCGRPATPP